MDPDAVAAVGVLGRADIPAVEAMWGPGAAVFGLNVGDHTTTRRANRCSIEVKVAIDLGVGRELGVEAGATEKVECDFGLLE